MTLTSALRGLRRLLPDGHPLPAELWRSRHLVILTLVFAHVPAIPLFALARGKSFTHALVEATPVALFGLASIMFGHRRRVAAIFATLGLITSSAVLTHLSGGLIEMHFHFFVAVALVTLYQDWPPFLVAIGYVVLHHGSMGALDPSSVYNHAPALTNPWKWAVIHGAFILAASAVGLANWKLNEQARRRAEDSYRRLYEGERALVRELEEAKQLREDLVNVVSHELRTPIAVLGGFAKTLRRHGGRLGEAERNDVLERMDRQAGRLHDLVENLLASSRAVDPGPTQMACLRAAVEHGVAEVARMPGADGMTFVVTSTEGPAVAASEESVRLVISNLLSNAVKHSRPATKILVSAQPVGDVMVLKVTSMPGRPIPLAEQERMFQPFVQLDSSATRPAPGIGLGLHIVRRLVDASGGKATVSAQDDMLTFTVTLPVVRSINEPTRVAARRLRPA